MVTEWEWPHNQSSRAHLPVLLLRTLTLLFSSDGLSRSWPILQTFEVADKHMAGAARLSLAGKASTPLERQDDSRGS